MGYWVGIERGLRAVEERKARERQMEMQEERYRIADERAALMDKRYEDEQAEAQRRYEEQKRLALIKLFIDSGGPKASLLDVPPTPGAPTVPEVGAEPIPSSDGPPMPEYSEPPVTPPGAVPKVISAPLDREFTKKELDSVVVESDPPKKVKITPELTGAAQTVFRLGVDRETITNDLTQYGAKTFAIMTDTFTSIRQKYEDERIPWNPQTAKEVWSSMFVEVEKHPTITLGEFQKKMGLGDFGLSDEDRALTLGKPDTVTVRPGVIPQGPLTGTEQSKVTEILDDELANAISFEIADLEEEARGLFEDTSPEARERKTQINREVRKLKNIAEGDYNIADIRAMSPNTILRAVETATLSLGGQAIDVRTLPAPVRIHLKDRIVNGPEAFVEASANLSGDELIMLDGRIGTIAEFRKQISVSAPAYTDKVSELGLEEDTPISMEELTDEGVTGNDVRGNVFSGTQEELDKQITEAVQVNSLKDGDPMIVNGKRMIFEASRFSME